MFSRDRVIRTLNHMPSDRAARDLWLAPGLEAEQADQVAEINARFPSDIVHLHAKAPDGKRIKRSQSGGPHTDAWGCSWQSVDHVTMTGLIGSPLAGKADPADYEPPSELLEPARFASLNAVCESSGRFALANSEVRPVGRLLQLRGQETAVTELRDDNPRLRLLLAKIHDFYRKEIELWAATQADGVVLSDDLSWVSAAPGHVQVWRGIFKPLLREYCELLHRRDKFVFFRCDGVCGDALEDLVEIGIDAVHSEWRPEELEKLARRYRGRVTFWGGIERARIEPPCCCNQIRDVVSRVRKALDYGAGGVISQISWNRQLPLQSVAAFFEQWLVPLAVTV
jgi:uroporphyrinogen decarboxylase